MPPEILTDSKGMCCKSQDISCGIMELAKIRYEFGSRIASGFPARLDVRRSLDSGIGQGISELKHAFQPSVSNVQTTGDF